MPTYCVDISFLAMVENPLGSNPLIKHILKTSEARALGPLISWGEGLRRFGSSLKSIPKDPIECLKKGISPRIL